jgi:hypothetical protein
MSQSLWEVAYYKLIHRRTFVFFMSLYQKDLTSFTHIAGEKVAGRGGFWAAVFPGGGMEIGGVVVVVVALLLCGGMSSEG